jgi:hypothetical protein
MFEIQLLSLFVGSLGLESLLLSGWLRWQQGVADRDCEEEENLTPYESKEIYTPIASPNGTTHSPQDPRFAGWEFKIVRADRDLFRNPAVFKQLCEEEAQAGWILLEKLDDRRVRFKRPAAVRDISKPELLSFDPYRTHYGPAPHGRLALAAIAFLVATLLPAYLGYVLISHTLKQTRLPGTSETSRPALKSAPPASPKASPAPAPVPAVTPPPPSPVPPAPAAVTSPPASPVPIAPVPAPPAP